jgi:hypothetical protein
VFTAVKVTFGKVAIVAEDHVFIRAEWNGISMAEAFAGGGRDFTFGVRLFEQIAVDVNLALIHLKSFTGNSNDALEEEDLATEVFNRDDIAALRVFVFVGEFVDEFDLTIAEGGQHAVAGDADGQEDKFKKNEDDEDDEENADNGPKGILAENKSEQER